MGIKMPERPPVVGTSTDVLLVAGLVLMRSTFTLIKAAGASIVTWCLLSLLRKGVFLDENDKGTDE